MKYQLIHISIDDVIIKLITKKSSISVQEASKQILGKIVRFQLNLEEIFEYYEFCLPAPVYITYYRLKPNIIGRSSKGCLFISSWHFSSISWLKHRNVHVCTLLWTTGRAHESGSKLKFQMTFQRAHPWRVTVSLTRLPWITSRTNTHNRSSVMGQKSGWSSSTWKCGQNIFPLCSVFWITLGWFDRD